MTASQCTEGGILESTNDASATFRGHVGKGDIVETVISTLNTTPRYREVGADPNRGLRVVSMAVRTRDSRIVETTDSVTTLLCDSDFGTAGVSLVGFF